MKTKILITNLYHNSKDDKNYTRLNYLLVDKDNFNDTSIFKGYSEITAFYNADKVFNLIPNEIIGKVVEGVFTEKNVRGKGLTTTWVLSSITYNGNSIDLL